MRLLRSTIRPPPAQRCRGRPSSQTPSTAPTRDRILADSGTGAKDESHRQRPDHAAPIRLEHQGLRSRASAGVEEESRSLRSFLRKRGEDDLFAAALTRTELIRAVAQDGTQAIADAQDLLSGLDTVALTRALLDDAGMLQPLHLRNLDAIHLTAARRAGATLRTVVTSDVTLLLSQTRVTFFVDGIRAPRRVGG